VLAGARPVWSLPEPACVLLKTYGASIFLGTPFLIGLVSAFVASRMEDKTRRKRSASGSSALLATGGTLMLLAMEGALCLVMAVPICVADRGARFVRRTSARRARAALVSRISRSCALVSLAVSSMRPCPRRAGAS
jgi:hypothetical protein